MVGEFKVDYRDRPVAYHGNNIAIIKDSDTSYFVVTHLDEYPKGKLNYLVIEWFARSYEEAEEVVKKLRGVPKWMI